MRTKSLIMSAPLLLFALPQPGFAKPSVLIIQPEGSQAALMENGSQVIMSELPGSTVIMRTPDPFDGGRTRIFFTFVNKGPVPVNVGPENITSGQIAVLSYDQLMAEQRKSESWDRVIGALGALGNSLSATDAGRQTTVTTYSGYADCGMSCGFTYRGTGVSQTYSPYAAQQARLQAEAQNRAAIASMNVDHASARNAIAANLRTTTVMPGHFITGMLTFEVPKAVRRGKQATPTALYIRVGSDVHVLKGYTGAIGTTPPPVMASSAARAVAPGVSSSIATSSIGPTAISSPTASPQDAYARAEAFYYGRGVPQDFSAAANFYRQAADQGDDHARYFLGTMYYQGKGVKQDYVTAFNLTRSAAERGHIHAQHNLGFMYESGRGVSQDFAAALAWYGKAAEQGDANAELKLGMLYHRGQGVPQDFATAAAWFRKAAEQGHANAQYNLGLMYYNGEGVEQSFSLSAEWMRKAADKGNAFAQANLGYLYENGLGVPQDFAAAVSWYRRAADQGLAHAQYNLGLLYKDGHGVPQNYTVAKELLKKAADQGHPGAWAAYKSML